jgi:hypothetical protein
MRAEAGGFLDLCYAPTFAAEVTLLLRLRQLPYTVEMILILSGVARIAIWQPFDL